MSKSAVVVVLVVVGLPALGACSPKDDAPRNGVNDVRKACDVRAAWPRAMSEQCILCRFAATSLPCECAELKEVSGLCKSQEDARNAERACTAEVKDCTTQCPATDCDCHDRCYAQAEPCKRVSGPRDGCVADVCTTHCQ